MQKRIIANSCAVGSVNVDPFANDVYYLTTKYVVIKLTHCRSKPSPNRICPRAGPLIFANSFINNVKFYIYVCCIYQQSYATGVYRITASSRLRQHAMRCC